MIKKSSLGKKCNNLKFLKKLFRYMCKNQKFCVYNFIMLDSAVLIFEIVKKSQIDEIKTFEDLRIMLPLNKKINSKDDC